MSTALTATNYKELTTAISANVRQLKESVPDVMTSFNALGKAALAPGAIDAKTKELIALAIGVAARCDGCLGYHTQALARLGATREEVHEMLGVAVYMGGGPSLMYAANTVAAFDEALAKSQAR
ncbi:MAG: alkylhydroperoxidase [Comamonas sp. SCN 67-35]|uniref:carboxymuconolactone decarboxylase family protein n=1 Tax=unclassified Comamonas TaxID=2638500 RepID=UPI00086D5F50|nr:MULTISPECIES: carboxymuconolactone decarboxylase family protein [unclassified Comamonas]MBN9330084.1 carboxymuconolactone decarboxylase family protein [Comamonas sp.]ODU39511.1 MAG: alkylhydroperoxidase [Comamonas sp. SCN 67-35]OJW99717.1 MAG: alkylhydroperoxidase [Burkholderiales bacterium 66-26]